jgi:glycosyltransferase involved in cell wall biosynthesis
MRGNARHFDSAIWRSLSTTVTLVIPAYNEAERLSRTMPLLRATFGDAPNVEVLIVDDGSSDGTADVVTTHIRGWSQARLVRLPWNQGKGAAIKAGVAAARGERIVFMDADLSADLADLPHLVAALDDAEVALGSRAIAGSRVVYAQSRFFRKLQSKSFNGLACAMVNVVASDTQCGFKAFRAPAGKLLFHLSEAKGFAFDVEVLALAQLLGFRIVEVPVEWVEAKGTTVKPVLDPIRMVRDLLRTRRRTLRLERNFGRTVWEAAEAPRVRAFGDSLDVLAQALAAETPEPSEHATFVDLTGDADAPASHPEVPVGLAPDQVTPPPADL